MRSARAGPVISLLFTPTSRRQRRSLAGKQKRRLPTCAATAGTGRPKIRLDINEKREGCTAFPFCHIVKTQPAYASCVSCRHSLFSRPVARQVFSTIMSLTSVFGMGTGGPSCQSTPTVKKKPDRNQVSSYVGTTYFPGQSPDKYLRRM